MHSIRLFLLVAALTALAGCQTAPPRRDPPPPRTQALALPAPEEQAYSDDVVEPQAAAPAESSRSVVEPGTGEFINRNAAARVVPTVPGAGDVTFNWENVPLQEVIKAILGDLLQENYVIAPGVQGSVTFSTSKPINASQARSVLEMLLSWNNAALVYKDGRYTVLPTAQALPGNLTPRIGPASTARGYEVRVVPLQFIAPTEMDKLLKPYAKPGAVISADNARSMIVLAGTASELQSYIDTIETFDVNWIKGMSIGIYPLERVEVGDVVPELEKIFGEGGPTPLAGMFRFLPIKRMNAVLVITPQEQYLREAETWIGRLDRGGSDAGAQLFVYYVKNVKAADLADKLTEVFSSSTQRSSVQTSAPVGAIVPGVESVEITTSETTPRPDRPSTPPLTPEAPKMAPSQSGEGIAIVDSDNIRISAIEESNALMVRATPGEYDAILKAIKRLDIVPLQVHIEAKILSVTLTNNLSLGVEWYFENATAPGRVPTLRSQRPTRNAWDSFAGQVTGQGLAWVFLNESAEALLNTLQSEGDAKVLSAPSLVVLNNKEASINVGTQLPVVSSFINTNNTGTDGGVGQSYVQFRDTGITLKVTPRVNPGGLVYMEITQEDSAPVPGSEVAGNVAVDQRQINTEIAVQSGQTVLLGGLIKEENSTSQNGIPFFSKIPIIGNLFGTTSKQHSRSELIVLITPTVIGGAQDAYEVTEDYKARFRGLRPILQQVAPSVPPPATVLPLSDENP